eukprot:COSAG02_NODE_409_length_22892_cov_11.461150_16_plen_655_part_00
MEAFVSKVDFGMAQGRIEGTPPRSTEGGGATGGEAAARPAARQVAAGVSAADLAAASTLSLPKGRLSVTIVECRNLATDSYGEALVKLKKGTFEVSTRPVLVESGRCTWEETFHFQTGGGSQSDTTLHLQALVPKPGGSILNRGPTSIGSSLLHISEICRPEFPAVDMWQSLLGTASGELRVLCFFVPNTEVKHMRRSGITSAADWLEMHSSATEIDTCGFTVTENVGEYRVMRNLHECLEARRMERWGDYQREHGSDMSTAAARLLTHGSEIRALARYPGVPQHARHQFWMSFGGAAHMKAEAEAANVASADGKTTPRRGSYYELMLGEYLRTELEGATTVGKQIDKDLDRTFAGENTAINTKCGRESLQRVLGAYSRRNREIGYCQSMNYLAGIMLIQSLEGESSVQKKEEDSFWLLASVVENILPTGWLGSDLLGIKIELQVLCELMEEQLPAVRKHLQLLEIPLELVASGWLMTLFSTTLPAETLFQLWDVLFCNGSRVLLAACLAVFSLLEQNILACVDFGDVSALLAHKIAGFHDPQLFIEVATGYMDQACAAEAIEEKRSAAASAIAAAQDPQRTANERCLLKTVQSLEKERDTVRELRQKIRLLEEQTVTEGMEHVSFRSTKMAAVVEAVNKIQGAMVSLCGAFVA